MTTVMDIRWARGEFMRIAVCDPDTIRIHPRVWGEVLDSCVGYESTTFDLRTTLCGMTVELDDTVDGFSISAESRCSYCRGGKRANERWCTGCEARRTMDSLLNRNQQHADSQMSGFTPWWTRCTPAELAYGIARLKRALAFCRGRAADLAPGLRAHISRLEQYPPR